MGLSLKFRRLAMERSRFNSVESSPIGAEEDEEGEIVKIVGAYVMGNSAVTLLRE